MFEELFGQDAAKLLLKNLVADGRVPPGVIIYGPPRTGKFLAAKQLGMIANCKLDGQSKCTCNSCNKSRAGFHPDMRILQPNDKGHITLEQVQENILDPFEFAVNEGKRKVAVIRQADKLQMAACHALLKTLEEPPLAATIILTTSKPENLLDTIKSRCQLVRLGFNSDQVLKTLLERDQQEVDPIVIELMGGSYSFAQIKDDLPNLKYYFDGSNTEVGEKIEADAIRNELIYLACAFAYMQRTNLQELGVVLVPRANSTKLGKLFKATDQALRYLNRGVRPFLVIKWMEGQVRDVLK